MQNLSARQLRQAADLKEKIEKLQQDLNHLLQGNGATVQKSQSAADKKRGPQSAAARERIAAAQRLRWAKFHEKKKKS